MSINMLRLIKRTVIFETLRKFSYNCAKPPFLFSHLDTIPNLDKFVFPTTLEGFGYKFEGGQLRHIETGAAFEFDVVKDNPRFNQRHYEALGEVVTEFVYEYIVKEGNLEKMHIPLNAQTSQPTTFIFHSQDAFTSPKIIVLIHGSGVVRAGQWSRRLIINDCLDSGTQLPFIKKAQSLGYGVFVLNSNDNTREINNSEKPIRFSDSPEAHATYVMEKIILKKASAKHIGLIAHSYGGYVAVNLISKFNAHLPRFFAVAFTDSVHSLTTHVPEKKEFIREWFRQNSKNWVSSHYPVDTPIPQGDKNEVPCVSAGTPRHDVTSWSSFESVFQFLCQKYDEFV